MISSVLILGIVAHRCYGGLELNRKQLRPYATIHRRTIRLIPSGATFIIPQSWVEWNHEYSKSLFLNPKELEAAKDTVGEFSRSYGEIVNAVVPFGSCAAHVGNDGWGKNAEGGSGSDLFMRVYVGSLNTQKIWQDIATVGKRKAVEFARKDSQVSLTGIHRGQWQGSKLSYYLFYGDYGGTAYIEFLHRTFGKQQVVIVFMYAVGMPEQQNAINSVLASFKWR